MAERVVVRMFLPLEMGAAAKIMQAVADAFPGARLGNGGDTTIVDLIIDEPDPPATPDGGEAGA